MKETNKKQDDGMKRTGRVHVVSKRPQTEITETAASEE